MGVSGAEDRTPLRVLYAEDDARDAILCLRQLQQGGFEAVADVVRTPEEFREKLCLNPYDVVLSDYRMPGWSALEALGILLEEAKEIPFILVTGTVGEETAVECIKQGAIDYVLKDRPARLPVAVRRALQEKDVQVERKRAERSRALLASIVASSDDAIIGIALDGAIVSWNRGAERIYGYAAEEVQGRLISILFAADGIDRLEAALGRLTRGESVGRYETVGTRKDGGLIDIAVTMSPIRDADGGVAAASAIAQDITENRRLQKEVFLAQKTEAIGRLAAGVAHDFNNLLTVITGYSSLALGRLRDCDPMYTEIREINRAGERAASLTRQLLAFSRKQVLHPKVLDLNGIVTDMERMLRRLIGEDIELVTVRDPSLGSIKADASQIEQVIMNLAVNARDAMAKGGRLTIRTANADLSGTQAERHSAVPPGAFVLLTVTDNGTGMESKTLARIFEPFFTTKGPAEGTGLGLATVYGIVKQSGGHIVVDSEPGSGTTFEIYLPRVQELDAMPEPAHAVRSTPGSATILVVEDEEAVRGLVCRMLQQLGYLVRQAKNGAEALRLCETTSDRIDLTLTDIVMPQMSGSELAERLSAIRPEMKILYMSGYIDRAIGHHGVLAPDVAILQKPFTPEALSRMVQEAIEGSQAPVL